MSAPSSYPFVSRGGEKLDHALGHFALNVAGWVCADLGSHVGGFVDCLLRRRAARVISVDTSYGTLAWRLRRDPRVTALERTNAMHVKLPVAVDLVTVDVGWTRQSKVLPNVRTMLKPEGRVVTLIKPHYEAPDCVVDGVLPPERLEAVLEDVLNEIRSLGWTIHGQVESPLRGHGGNREFLVLLS